MRSIIPTRPFSYTEIAKVYRLNATAETANGFYVAPSSPVQGHELFFLPRELPIKDIENRIPYDLLKSAPDDIISKLAEALNLEELLDELYNVRIRCVDLLPDRISLPIAPHKDMLVLQPANPEKAQYFQITGTVDVSFGSNNVMCPLTPLEERLNSLSTYHYHTHDPIQGYLYLEWLIPCSTFTAKIRREYAKECLYYSYDD